MEDEWNTLRIMSSGGSVINGIRASRCVYQRVSQLCPDTKDGESTCLRERELLVQL